MTGGERKLTEMLLAMARTVRRGRRVDPEMAAAAAARELQFQQELETAPNVLPIAAGFARRDEDPGANGTGQS